MMAAGVPLLQSFDIIAKLRQSEHAQAGGGDQASCRRQQPSQLAAQAAVFDSLYCNLVDAEQSSALETCRPGRHLQGKTEALKAKIKKARPTRSR